MIHNIDLTKPLDSNHWMVRGCCLWLKAINSHRSFTYYDLTHFKNHVPLVSRGVSGGYPWETGKGRGLTLNCSHFRVPETANPNIPTGNSSRTVIFWMKRNSLGQSFTVLVMGALNTDGEYFTSSTFRISADPTYVAVDATGGSYIVAEIPEDTNWHMIAFVYPSGVLGNCKIYYDGVEKTVYGNAAFYPINTGGAIALGYLPYDGGRQYFDGLLDDIRIYNRALSAGEIRAIYDDSVSMRYEAINQVYNSSVAPLYTKKYSFLNYEVYDGSNTSYIDAETSPELLTPYINDGVNSGFADYIRPYTITTPIDNSFPIEFNSRYDELLFATGYIDFEITDKTAANAFSPSGFWEIGMDLSGSNSPSYIGKYRIPTSQSGRFTLNFPTHLSHPQSQYYQSSGHIVGFNFDNYPETTFNIIYNGVDAGGNHVNNSGNVMFRDTKMWGVELRGWTANNTLSDSGTFPITIEGIYRGNASNDFDMYVKNTLFSSNSVDMTVLNRPAVNNNTELYIDGKETVNDNTELYIKGKINLTHDINMRIRGYDNIEDNQNLYIKGREVLDNPMNLYTDGQTNTTENISLSIIGLPALINDNTLFIRGYEQDSSSLDVFVGGKWPDSDVDLYIKGHQDINNNTPLYIMSERSSNFNLFVSGRKNTVVNFASLSILSGGLRPSENQQSLFIEGSGSTTSINLFVDGGDGNISDVINMFTLNDSSVNKNVNLYIHNEYVDINNNFPISIRGPDGSDGFIPATGAINMVLKGENAELKYIPLSLLGYYTTENNLNLYVNSGDKSQTLPLVIPNVSENNDGSVKLYTHGF